VRARNPEVLGSLPGSALYMFVIHQACYIFSSSVNWKQLRLRILSAPADSTLSMVTMCAIKMNATLTFNTLIFN